MVKSSIKRGHHFWLASVLVFFTVIRRELNYLPDLLIAPDFSLLGYVYDWWEDLVLTIIYIITIGLLIYSWRYCWALLKHTAVALYIAVAVLALFQYMGEHAIVFPTTFGMIVEELSELIIYSIALVYLWHLKLPGFEGQSTSKLRFEVANQ